MNNKIIVFCLFFIVHFFLFIMVSCASSNVKNKENFIKYKLIDYIPVNKNTVVLITADKKGREIEFKKKFIRNNNGTNDIKTDMQDFLQWLDARRWKSITIWYDKNERGERIIESVK